MGGHGHYNPEAAPRLDQDIELLKKEQVRLAFRDTCAHLLVPLNRCRSAKWFSPYSCGHERHTYEQCQYYAYLQRMEAKKQQDLMKKQQET
jgi:NADH dehydrogenase (ubiquinone) 1 beta subcomplex subunit 7